MTYCAASDRTRTHGHGHGNGHGKVARDRKGRIHASRGVPRIRVSTLGSAASRQFVKAPPVRARAPTRARGHTENDADAGPIELVAQDSVPPSRHSLVRKRIEGEGGAVNIEPFVLQKHLRAGFHVFLSVRLENLLRPAFGDLADAARTAFLSRATFPWPLPWPWPCVRVRSDAAQ
jgi:hypothetical protein